MVTEGKGGRDKLGDWDWHMHAASYKIGNTDLLYAQGTLLRALWRPMWEKNLERVDVCIQTPDSLCWTAATNITL